MQVIKAVRQQVTHKVINMSGKLEDVKGQMQLNVSDPPDFTKDAQQYRRNVLLSTSLAFVLVMSTSLDPKILGVEILPVVMWSCLAIAHIYHFVMWRLTSPIEMDTDTRFFNIKGLWKQAIAGGTKDFPGKIKAQIIMLRAIPIWAFLFGTAFILIGISKC
ncbi:hypothetical protein [Candidatus Thiodiazotropha sp. CDECU1]|uniref:hypothetical protein n=1 Tax=Candidatus Thiodiazotropha sp. CDECU1 TaxID=3065865 RepID=UPI002931667D|nr:hypothetical protein [Candidatus Thiodiazotropha sp. CDECU1]